jgi:hypothetical protein
LASNAVTSDKISPGAVTNSDISNGAVDNNKISSLSGSKITTGTVNFNRLPTGTSSSTVAIGNHNHDTRYVRDTGGQFTGSVIFPNGSFSTPGIRLQTTAGIYSAIVNSLQVKAGSLGFRFSGNGNFFGPESDGGPNLGASGFRWDTVYAVSGSINTSDLREKENIRAIPYGLKEVLSVDPIVYNWAEDLGRSTEDRLGFGAQDVMKVIPEAISVPLNPDHMLGMNSDMMVAVLWQAVKELSGEVATLKERLGL